MKTKMKNLIKVSTVSLVALTLILGSVGSAVAGSKYLSNKRGYSLFNKFSAPSHKVRKFSRKTRGGQTLRQRKFQNRSAPSVVHMSGITQKSRVVHMNGVVNMSGLIPQRNGVVHMNGLIPQRNGVIHMNGLIPQRNGVIYMNGLIPQNYGVIHMNGIVQMSGIIQMSGIVSMSGLIPQRR